MANHEEILRRADISEDTIVSAQNTVAGYAIENIAPADQVSFVSEVLELLGLLEAQE